MLQVGERLSQERRRRGLTIDEVSKATKIKSQFLRAIERGDYELLPSSAYAKGFVRNYAAFLGLSQREITAFFRREFDEEKAMQVLPRGLPRKKDFSIGRRRIQQTAIFFAITFFALCLFLVFQYRYTFINPPLAITIPQEGSMVSSQTITIAGKTSSNAIVTINGDIVSVDQDGNFKKEVDVFSGRVTLRIAATNRFGRQTVIDRHIIVSQAQY